MIATFLLAVHIPITSLMLSSVGEHNSVKSMFYYRKSPFFRGKSTISMAIFYTIPMVFVNQRNHITGSQPVAQLSFQVSLDALSAFGNSQTGCLRQGFVVWALGATLLSNENHGNGTKICAKGTYMVAE